MFFDKRRYIVNISGGKGSINTDRLRGMVAHFVVRPKSELTIWSLDVLDKESDEMREIKNHVGRLDDFNGITLGKDDQELVTLRFYDVSSNEPIKVIFKIREIE